MTIIKNVMADMYVSQIEKIMKEKKYVFLIQIYLSTSTL